MQDINNDDNQKNICQESKIHSGSGINTEVPQNNTGNKSESREEEDGMSWPEKFALQLRTGSCTELKIEETQIRMIPNLFSGVLLSEYFNIW